MGDSNLAPEPPAPLTPGQRSGEEFWSDFPRGATVIVDGDRSLTARVTGHLWRHAGAQLELSWFANGVQQQVWVDDDRCSRV